MVNSRSSSRKSSLQGEGQKLEEKRLLHAAGCAVDQIVAVYRPPLNLTQLHEQFEYEGSPKKDRILVRAKRKLACSPSSFGHFFLARFPILTWLLKYDWKRDLLWDVVSGCTVAVMHIPQGMGYAMLGNVPPIVGIYVAFFPVLLYVFLGTSRHVSIGTFAVTMLMAGRIVDQYSSPESVRIGENSTDLSPTQVGTVVCLGVGLWQSLMFVLRLGVLGIILSDPLVSGFTTGAAVHVLTAQIKNLLGISVQRYNGPFRLIYTYIEIIKKVPTANIAEVVVSIITIFVMAINNDYLKPIYSKRLKFPIPVELLVIIVGTLTSYCANLQEMYGVKIIEHIPTGIPEPRVPPIWLLPKILVDTCVIAVVAYAVSLSMAKIFAKKHQYVVDDNQELFALGISNVFGSFFSCLPCTASLSRSLIQEAVGGKTQIASVVSCSLLIFVLLFIGPFFEALPLSVLSSIIVVALKGMFMQAKDFKRTLKTSPPDAIVWGVAFMGVVLIDIDVGLGMGVVMSLGLLLYRNQNPYSCWYGNLPGTELYLDLERYSTAVEDPDVKVFHYSGGVHFANCESIRGIILKDLLNPTRPDPIQDEVILGAVGNTPPVEPENGLKDLSSAENSQQHDQKYLVFDCSAISFSDLSGARMLTDLTADLKTRNYTLILATCTESFYEHLTRCEFFKKFPHERVYATIHDAVLCVKKNYV